MAASLSQGLSGNSARANGTRLPKGEEEEGGGGKVSWRRRRTEDETSEREETKRSEINRVSRQCHRRVTESTLTDNLRFKNT